MTYSILPNGTESSFGYSNRCYRERSGTSQRIRQANKKNKNNQAMITLQQVSTIAPRGTVDTDLMDLRAEMLSSDTDDQNGLSVYHMIFQDLSRRRHRENKFRAWQRRVKELSSFVASLSRNSNGKKTILLFEDGSFDNRRGNASAPIKAFKRMCEQQYPFISVPAWMTSQTCPYCFARFPKTVKVRSDDSFHTCYVRGLLRCQSTFCKCSPYQGRDIVGAACTHHVGTTMFEDLPVNLRRDQKDLRLDRPSNHVLLV